MPIQPIDLQVLFSHLNQVGKEQAAQKDAAILQQASQAGEMVKKSQEQEHSVDRTKEMEQGPEKTHDDKERKQRRGAGEKRKEEPREKQDEEDILKDPDLGHHIDISG